MCSLRNDNEDTWTSVQSSIQEVFIGQFTKVHQGWRLVEAELVLRRVGDVEGALP